VSKYIVAYFYTVRLKLYIIRFISLISGENKYIAWLRVKFNTKKIHEYALMVYRGFIRKEVFITMNTTVGYEDIYSFERGG